MHIVDSRLHIALLRFAAAAWVGALAACADLPKPVPGARADNAATTTAPAQAGTKADALDDGPHIEVAPGGNGYVAWWVCNGQVIRLSLPRSPEPVVAPQCAFPLPIALRDESIDFPVPVKYSAPKLAALSDVHGQFDLLVRLLKAQGILNANLNWTFGDGHLVVTGDHFDRGPQVTEVLWLLYRLEAEARAAGGALHVLLGNHETMVFYDDLRYVHAKYPDVARRLQRSYPALYGEATVLGRWLRAKPVLLQINDLLFVHGGLSPQVAALGLSLQEGNEAIRAVLGQPRERVRAAALPALLYGSNGPLWYRGYFHDPLIGSEALDRILAQYGVKRIVVGHTSFTGVFSHWGGRVLNTDSGMQGGKRGELLRWEGGRFTRGGLDGRQAPLTEFMRTAETVRE